MHVCPAVGPGPVPHVGGPYIAGSTNVLTGKIPQVRLGDQCICVGPIDAAASGSTTVLVNKKPAVRITDSTGHGGKVVAGLPNVLIGSSGGSGGGPPASAAAAPGGGASGGWGLGAPFAELTNAAFEQLSSGKTLADLDAQIQEATGGLTLEQVQNVFRLETSEELPAETLDLLFNGNAAQAGAAVTADSNLHTTLRDILNTNRPGTVAEARAQGWQELPQSKNAFHDPARNIKFVGPKCYRELVIDPLTDIQETRDRYRESFNFRPPSDAAGHTALDVVPYGVRDPVGFGVGAGRSAAEAGSRAGAWVKDTASSAGKWASDTWSSWWD